MLSKSATEDTGINNKGIFHPFPLTGMQNHFGLDILFRVFLAFIDLDCKSQWRVSTSVIVGPFC